MEPFFSQKLTGPYDIWLHTSKTSFNNFFKWLIFVLLRLRWKASRKSSTAISAKKGNFLVSYFMQQNTSPVWALNEILRLLLTGTTIRSHSKNNNNNNKWCPEIIYNNTIQQKLGNRVEDSMPSISFLIIKCN